LELKIAKKSLSFSNRIYTVELLGLR